MLKLRNWTRPRATFVKRYRWLSWL